MNDKQARKVLIIFIIGMCLLCMAPYLFTRNSHLINFTETGQIGDTIVGITASIASLLGSVLVFYALKAQIEANKLVQIQFRQQRLDEMGKKKLSYLAEQIN